ncbi:HTH-type transcriptional activator IlvY [Thalassotalea maritima]|uniref:HTH-type transcriptional activator IlvY n=1 Tax=Thalassotalea maritima TaxID=3242416 RepID=UPI00352773B5
MEKKLLEVYVHLCDTLHFGQTAYAHHVSPSTLSRMIQRIEQELATSLLVRDNRSVVLTRAGQQFRAFAKQQLAAWQQFEYQLSEETQQLSGRLKIYCSVTAAYSHLPRLLDTFREHHPKVEILLQTGNANEAIDKVSKGEADVAIAAADDRPNSAIYFQPIADIELAVIAPTLDCHVAHLIKQTPIDWQQIPVIFAEHGPAREQFIQLLRLHGVQHANVYATVSGHEALVSMVALGCGIGIAPQVVIDNSPMQQRVEVLDLGTPPASFTLGLCCQQKQRQQPIIDAFLQCLATNSLVEKDQ